MKMKGITCCGDCGYYDWKKHKCSRVMSIEADPKSHFFNDCPLPDVIEIQVQRVFSLDEMKTLSESGEPVFVETADGECRWALMIPGIEPPDKDGFRYPGGVLFNAIDANDEIYDGDFYGMKMPDGRPHHLAWRAWSSRSSEGLRRNTPW